MELNVAPPRTVSLLLDRCNTRNFSSTGPERDQEELQITIFPQFPCVLVWSGVKNGIVNVGYKNVSDWLEL